jgi:pimeloyl-ACP methyl ester carboxylesterase
MAVETRSLPTDLPTPPVPQQEPRTFAVPAPPPPDTVRTGIVFVHGIGTQVARETLFDWARPIIEVLAEWRREYDEEHPDATVGENPVSAASVTDQANPWIEVDVPAFADRARSQWLFTEAYWAGDIRAPSFADAARYLFRRIPGVVSGIAQGYGVREDRRKARLRKLIAENENSPDDAVQARVEDLRRSLRGRWRITDTLDRVWQVKPVRWLLGFIATLVALVVLGIYTGLHAIPIEAVRKKVDIALADTFIVEWFGDLPIILDDQAQSAAIRTRLLERVNWLNDNECENVVLVAHSGGTIVSYATLLRYEQDKFKVAKLITLGEAIKLGWRLEHESRDWLPGNTIRGDVKANHPELRWVDIWASYDPAPSGPLAAIDGCPLVAVERLSDLPEDPRIHVESRPVTNFMHLALDHGGYWQNDEGFLIPVIRHLDDAAGDGTASRFYRNQLDRTVRTERRIRRVAMLLAWRWTGLAFGIAALVAAMLRSNLAATGDSVAGVFGLLPGHEIVSGTIDGIGNVISVIFNAIGWTAVPERLDRAGPLILGGLVPVLAVFAIYRRGVLSWQAHDAIERKKIRRERFAPPGERSARSEAVLLIGGLVAVVLAALVLPIGLVAAWILVIAVFALFSRFVTWF